MRKLISGIIGGIAGAVALNILHQTVQQFVHEAPRVDLVGEEGITKVMEKAGLEPLTGSALFSITMAADLLSNAAYYSLAGFDKRKQLTLLGTDLGLAAGAGALALTKPMGLSDAPVTRTNATKIMTVGWYTFGGMVAGLTMKALRR